MNDIYKQLGEDFIDTFIPSKDTRSYLHKISHEFTLKEKAIIIANHFELSFEQKIVYLNALLELCDDYTLCRRIQEELLSLKKKLEDVNGYHDPFSSGALFDYVFIPHDFRHGDMVVISYDLWGNRFDGVVNGIILNYDDEYYEFQKRFKGDYSDTQITIDTKFINHEYQGEFAHEHINPIYIERLEPALSYESGYYKFLTDYYGENKDKILTVDRIDAVIHTLQKAWYKHPELALKELILNKKTLRDSGMDDIQLMDDLYDRYLKEEPSYDEENALNEDCISSNVPIYDNESDTWRLNTDHGFEIGDAAYIAGEFCHDNAVYPYDINGRHEHSHCFESVIETILRDHDSFSIDSYKDAYSAQELRIIANLLKAYQNKGIKNDQV